MNLRSALALLVLCSACGGASASSTRTSGASQPAVRPAPSDPRALIASDWHWLVEVDQAPETVSALSPYLVRLASVGKLAPWLADDTVQALASGAQRFSLFASDVAWSGALADITSPDALRGLLETIAAREAQAWQYRDSKGFVAGPQAAAYFDNRAGIIGPKPNVRTAVDAAYDTQADWRIGPKPLASAYDVARAGPVRVIGAPSKQSKAQAAQQARAIDIRIAEALPKLQALGLSATPAADGSQLRVRCRLFFTDANAARTINDRLRRLLNRTTVRMSMRLMGLGFVLKHLELSTDAKHVDVAHSLTPAELGKLINALSMFQSQA